MKYLNAEVFYPVKRELQRTTYREHKDAIEKAASVIAGGVIAQNHTQNYHEYYIRDQENKNSNILFARIYLEIREVTQHYTRLDEMSQELLSMRNEIQHVDGGSLVNGYAGEIDQVYDKLRNLIYRIQGEWGIPSDYGKED